MKIYSMTATFGKLENQTLTLNPGLNIIQAPNEWGKSTWCAFLLNMLYGIDTRERVAQGSIPAKDRYAPWSGRPMSGKIELCWNGRDITIERSSNPRTPLGDFRAYETATGVDVPELTAANCGQTLLGVERNVFVRAGFLKLADLPVTQDDALRRRLNNLVTTGDESGDADKLNQTLRDLKNKCRSNRANGLIPEAEAEHGKLQNQLWELQELQTKTQNLEIRREQLENQLAALENHKQALQYAAAQKDAQQVQQAKQAAADSQEKVDTLADAVSALPSRKEAEAACRQAEALQAQGNLLLQQQQTLPQKPVGPSTPACFEGKTPQQAVEAATADFENYSTLTKKQKTATAATIWMALLAVLCCGCIVAGKLFLATYFMPVMIGGGVVCLVALIMLFVSIGKNSKAKTALQQLLGRYSGQTPDSWISAAEQYAEVVAQYENALESYHNQAGAFLQQQENHQAQLSAFAGEQTLSEKQAYFEKAASLWQALDRAREDLQQAQNHAQSLSAMAKTAAKPERPDTLTYDEPETDARLYDTKQALQQTIEQLAQAKGRMEALGQPAAIQTKLDAVSRRISRLETYNAAIELAQDALYKTTLALQRRFAPRITKITQELFSKLTDGRYQKITLDEKMDLWTASVDEVNTKELRRRSDGTIDQLYLALRLAVARELTPEAPLVLDDALVRFDDVRLAKAMEILKEESSQKQVIVFTCQSRETSLT